ncbi:hypothetical protein QF042_004650 [Pedobacter sp. W3I1]|uniref:type IX secretion system outer membrane channel protein PorV n=1 Tax=Pedobacter sp. W3I1 TaxID=3042291 RepID=UPI00278647F4|nr:type IX secretion system outer membrane channel protein PorV [Pedobacter sp. W3I1]MDQ0641085.1 hypothetical protein [Pedobacter sp. W3I1]
MKIRSTSTPTKKWVLLILIFLHQIVSAQSINGIQTDASARNNIYTAVPFLLITPQPRSGAMGNAGVALDPDANSTVMNTSSLAFLPDGDFGISCSYSPWLKQLAPDMSISYLSGYYRVNQRNTISASLRYFSMGEVNFSDENFQSLGVYSPNEAAFDLGYSLKLGPDFALGGNIRYISSNLFGGGTINGNSGSGKALAVDVSAFQRLDIMLAGTPAVLSFGLNLSNIGTKMTYRNTAQSYFLPANMKLGSALKIGEGQNKLTLLLDFNKLMVPTPPVYDSNGNIIKGRDPDRSVPSGIFGSFSDAPGGFSEELKEVGISTGAEMSFKETLYIRAGYLYQHPEKANTSYLTLGLGIHYSNLSLDFSYLVGSGYNPLRNTLRFGIQTRFSRFK